MSAESQVVCDPLSSLIINSMDCTPKNRIVMDCPAL